LLNALCDHKKLEPNPDLFCMSNRPVRPNCSELIKDPKRWGYVFIVETSRLGVWILNGLPPGLVFDWLFKLECKNDAEF
jgi:hypothetical protein